MKPEKLQANSYPKYSLIVISPILKYLQIRQNFHKCDKLQHLLPCLSSKFDDLNVLNLFVSNINMVVLR